MDPTQVPIPPAPSSQPEANMPPAPNTSVPGPTIPIAADQPAIPGMICPQCHFPVKPEQYYCPNCGKALHEPPLSTSIGTQIFLYAWSIVLPILAFVTVSRWPAIKYFRSKDPKTQQIGLIAIFLMAISTIITFWLLIVWLQQYVQQSLNDANNLMGGGGLY